MSDKNFHYAGYLKLDSLLNAQGLQSALQGKPCHDELFFIIVHQVTELWFKQILAELDSILKLITQSKIAHADYLVMIERLTRISKIQKVLIAHIEAIETLSAQSFLQFRELLGNASGFQSVQFRLLEAKLGVPTINADSLTAMREQDRAKVQVALKQTSLFTALQSWLEKLSIAKDFKVQNLEQDNCCRRLSKKACIHALFIQANYMSEPYDLYAQLLNHLIDIDENMASWRQQHALMVQRMLGHKTGTGGTSGYDYLQQTIKQTRVFDDLANLATYYF